MNDDGKKELVILGYSAPDFPTSLAVFHWVDKGRGYQAMIHGGRRARTCSGAMPGSSSNQPLAKGPPKESPSDAGSIIRIGISAASLADASFMGGMPTKRSRRRSPNALIFAFGWPEGASKPGEGAYPVAYPEATALAYYEQGQVQKIATLREDKNEAQVTVKVIVDGQLVEQICELTRTSTGRVKDVARWEVGCP